MKRLLIVVLWFTWMNPVFAMSVPGEHNAVESDSTEVLKYYIQSKEMINKRPEAALLLLDEAEALSMRSGKKYMIGDIYGMKGNAFRCLKNNVSALKNYHAASLWYKKQQDSVSLAGTYVNIARVCSESGDTSGDERYLKLADRVCPGGRKALSVKNIIQLNLGVMNFRRGNHDIALKCFSTCLEISRELKEKNHLSLAYNNLAMAYMMLDKDVKAGIYADSALKVALKEGNSYFLAIAYSTKADLTCKQKQYTKAIDYYKKSLEFGKKYNYYADVTVGLYREIYTCYSKLEDYKNALKYHELYMINKDSAYSIEKLEHISEIESKYKLEQKNATIAHLNRQNILKSELAERQRIVIIAVVFALILLIALMVVFARYHGKVRKLNHLLREKSKRISEQNKCIEVQKTLLQKEASKLESENIIAHFEILKNQVNPHMLFNALAVLKTIIDKDKCDAKGFVDDLANVFRQALELKRDLLVKVTEELSFVESYINIISKQYENCFTCRINIPDEIKEYYIPPFSLQLMVENVIKHNELCEEEPVHMEIFYKNETIQIDNTCVRKKKKDPGPGGVGQQNLISRYKLVSEKAPHFVSDETFFSVRLPLFISE